jgi:O-antigen/teichoic acid export membrane protein
MTIGRMFRLILSLVGTRFAGAALGLLSQLMLARLFSRDDVGIIFLGMSGAAFASLVMTGGYPTLALTCLPRYQALGRTIIAKAFLGALVKDALAVAAMGGTLAVLAYYLLPLSQGAKTVLFFACLTAPSSSLIRINSSIANSRRRYALSYVPDFIYRPGLLLLYIVLVWLAGVHLSVAHVLWAFLATNIAVAIGQSYLLGSTGLFSNADLNARHNLAPNLRWRAAALMIVAAVATTFADLVTLISGFLLPAADVAVLGVAVRLAGIVGFVTQAAQQFVLPDLTAAMAKQDSSEVRAMLLKVNMITLAATGAATVGAALLGGPVLRIYGEGYESGKWALVLFMVGQAFRAAGGMNQYLLSLAGFQIKTAGACIAAIAVLLGSWALFAPRFGIIGVAMAVIVCEIAWAALLGAQAKRLAGQRGDILALL